MAGLTVRWACRHQAIATAGQGVDMGITTARMGKTDHGALKKSWMVWFWLFVFLSCLESNDWYWVTMYKDLRWTWYTTRTNTFYGVEWTVFFHRTVKEKKAEQVADFLNSMEKSLIDSGCTVFVTREEVATNSPSRSFTWYSHIAPDKLPKPNRKGSLSKHHFFRGNVELQAGSGRHSNNMSYIGIVFTNPEKISSCNASITLCMRELLLRNTMSKNKNSGRFVYVIVWRYPQPIF